MYREPTVFLLGAGASWHYGYPTGDELIKRVRNKASALATYFRNCSNNVTLGVVPRIVQQWQKAPDVVDAHGIAAAFRQGAVLCEEIREKIDDVNPLVIDYFLSSNPGIAEIGRFLIAMEILECEWVFNKMRKNQNRDRNATGNDDWYRFVIDKMIRDVRKPEQLLQNTVRFVTFNYDTSLEAELSWRLKRYEVLKESDVVDRFLAENVVHVYGRVAHEDGGADFSILPNFVNNGVTTSMEVRAHRTKYTAILNNVHVAAQSIRTISDDKAVDIDEINRAKAFLSEGEKVYIFGFGFDENNCRLLQLNNSLTPHDHKRVHAMITNFGAVPKVEKLISSAFGAYKSQDGFRMDVADSDVYKALDHHFL